MRETRSDSPDFAAKDAEKPKLIETACSRHLEWAQDI